MWVIKLRIVQLVWDLLSQLESTRKIAGGEQATQPETSSQAQGTIHPRLTTLQNSEDGGAGGDGAVVGFSCVDRSVLWAAHGPFS